MNYVVPGLLALLLVEVLLASWWWRPYFTSGLVLFRTVVSPRGSRPAVNLEDVTAHFRGRLGPSLVFHRLDPEAVAFREAVFELKLFNYTPVMHGLLRVVPGSGDVVVEGRANWFSLGFSILAAVFVWSRLEAWPILVFLGILLGGIRAVQASTYRQVGQVFADGAAAHQAGQQTGSSHGRFAGIVAFLLFLLGVVWWLTN